MCIALSSIKPSQSQQATSKAMFEKVHVYHPALQCSPAAVFNKDTRSSSQHGTVVCTRDRWRDLPQDD